MCARDNVASSKPFDSQELSEIRSEFPALRRYVYLASNGLGLLPRRAAAAAKATLRKLMLDGIVFEIFQAPSLVERARARVAAFLGASAEDVAFCRNTSEGLLWFASSAPWQPGDEVLLVWGSHPTTVLPFLVRQNLQVRWVYPRDGRVSLEQFAQAWSERTRCVVVSWVEFHNGFRHDLEKLGTLVQQRGAWLVCDAVQGWGALPFRARALSIGAAAAGAQKWLLGPPGIGVFYVDKSLRARMRVEHVGAGSLADPHEPEGPIVAYDTRFASSARRFEEGSRNLVGIAALERSVQWLDELGIERIAAQIHALTAELVERVGELGWTVSSPRGANEWSGILLLRPPAGENAEQWMHRLHEQHIAINHREGCLHLGVHFYNSVEDLDALVAALAHRAR